MTELTISNPTLTAAGDAAPSAVISTVEPTLITENEVLFGTAAAAAMFPPKTRGWTAAVVSFVAAVRRAAGPPEPVRRHHSERYACLQNSLMSREMDRL